MDISDISDLAAQIKKTKKYRRIYTPLLERVCAEESAKYAKSKPKDKIKAVKSRLHAVYGAFCGENCVKSAETLVFNAKNKTDINNMTEMIELSGKLMGLSVSTSERLGFIREFYGFIFNFIPARDIKSVLDAGCGFNPFALPFMSEAAPDLNISAYHALDIDEGLAAVINDYFSLLGLPKYAGCIDIIAETPPQKTDAAFLFKIIPTVETCKKGRGFGIINNINAKYIILSFPTKTLCGKTKNMAENYADFFEKNINRDKFKIIAKSVFKNELVYIISRNKNAEE